MRKTSYIIKNTRKTAVTIICVLSADINIPNGYVKYKVSDHALNHSYDGQVHTT